VTSILLIRHGQSEWNAEGRWQGRADSPLSQLGREQARHAASRLPSYDVLAASTLLRARQTAEEIADIHGGVDVQLNHGLVERDAGGFSGLTRDEIDARYPGYLARGKWPDGWEHDAKMMERVRQSLSVLGGCAPGGVVVAITHGGVIYALEAVSGELHSRIANLEGRWFYLDANEDVTLGDRVHLLDAVDETTPNQL
jgi:broad specificity phosphatase PhoE